MLDYIINWSMKNHPIEWNYAEAKRIFRRIERLEGMKIINWTIDSFYQMGLNYLDMNLAA